MLIDPSDFDTFENRFAYDLIFPPQSDEEVCRRINKRLNQWMHQKDKSDEVKQQIRKAGKQGTDKQYAEKREWYTRAVDQAAQEWERGSMLRQDQMATRLLRNAPTGISRSSLVKNLTAHLKRINRHDLIRGLKK